MTKPTVTPVRTCTKCSFTGTPNNFHRGFSICNQCYEVVKEKNRASCRKWKREYPEKYKAAQKKWYDKNKERKCKDVRTYSKQRYENDPEWREMVKQRGNERYQRIKTDPQMKELFRNRSAAWSYKYNYGLSVDDVAAMVKAQLGQCGLCGLANKKLVIDHDHNTGKVRAMLCNRCNMGLGCFRDSIKHLQRAIDYLTQHAQADLF